ncbi:306_t:CDS:1 [Paraglomus brasilianum]|uniref:306_t:CDS:1 n=1 Tax=Paraglomus brasilianum TaxID=144538 RepID=A0A9N8W477_9GLOM|nr:306_t:CDS:1 [Paraglomus brasilianum]
MTTILPMEILVSVLESLELDLGTLFVCSLACRGLCKVAVPILYRQPFQLCQESSYFKLVSVYLPYLPEFDRQSPNIYELPLFDYPSYLQSVSGSKLQIAIDAYNKECEGMPNLQEVKPLRFLHMLLTNARQILHLGLEEWACMQRTSVFNELYVTSQSQRHLKSLEISVNGRSLLESFYTPTSLEARIAALIRAQKELEVFAFDGQLFRHESEIMDALLTQKNTLRELRIYCKYHERFDFVSWLKAVPMLRVFKLFATTPVNRELLKYLNQRRNELGTNFSFTVREAVSFPDLLAAMRFESNCQ